VGADKVLLFIRSIDRVEWKAIGNKLIEGDRANGLTEDWLRAERVCRRTDGERACRAKRKTRDDAPSQQEEGAWKGEAARLGLGARIEEA
jgi:hypothetical protein